jgi:hypothetical protein
MENNKTVVAPQGGGAVGGAQQQNPPAELEVVRQYQNEIREAVVNAVETTRSCVLFYRDIYYELRDLFDDVNTFRQVESALWSVLDGLKLGDVTLYKIYVDPEESFHEVVVAVFGRELTEDQLRVLREVASLFGTDFYDRYSEEDGEFFNAMPLHFYHREEIYVTLHNLVKMWTGCGGEDDRISIVKSPVL